MENGQRASQEDASQAVNPPNTLQQLTERLQVLLPDLRLNDPARPVVVLANVGNDGAAAWRALAFDSDVRELFKSCAVSDDRATLQFQVRELFPQAEPEPHIVRISFALGASARDMQKPRLNAARGQSTSPARGGRSKARHGGCGTLRAGSRSNRFAKKVCSAPASAPPPPKTERYAPAPQPAPVSSAVPGKATAPVERSTISQDTSQFPEVTLRAPVRPSVPMRPSSAPLERRDQAPEMVPQAPARPAVPVRPSSAPSERRRSSGFRHVMPRQPSESDFRRAMPRRPSEEAPLTPKYDGRPGRRLDLEWAGKTTIAAKTGCLSTYMLEAVGLREKYEQLRRDSVHSQAALKKVLEARDVQPGSPDKSASAALWPSTHRDQSGVESGPASWERGQFCPVATHDIAKINQVIASLAEIENGAITRLEDCPVGVTWNLTNAKSRISIEKRISYGRPQLIPKRLLVESPWLPFGDLGKVIFRLYPSGDGSASEGQAAIFLWMSRPPGISFTFNFSLVCSGSQEADSKAQLSTAPRLWQSHEVHYRLDLAWAEVAAVLLDVDAEKCIDVTIRVLQWHAIEGLQEYASTGEFGVQARTTVDLPPGALRRVAL